MNTVFIACVLVIPGWAHVDWSPEELVANELVHDRFEDVKLKLFALDANGAPIDEQRALQFELVAQLEAEYGRGVLVQQVVFAEAEARRMVPQEGRELVSGFMLVGQELRPTLEEVIEYLGPYWPTSDSTLRELIKGMIHAGGHRLDRESGSSDSDIVAVVARLESAREAGDTRYQGLIDYIFERDAIAAWLAMLEMEGVDEDERDELFERVVKVLHPYSDTYRARPDRLPSGSREGLHGLLIEYSQDDSLWARVFVAEILNKVPYMRDPEIEASLRDDPHWLIQRRMAYLDEDEKSD